MARAVRVLTLGFLLGFTFADNARAQFDLESSLTVMYDDNINNNHLQIGDKVSTLNLNTGFGLEFSDWQTRVSYDGILNYYQAVIERTNQFHSGSLGIMHNSGEDGADVLSLGLSFGQGFYRDSYSFYDHTVLSATAHYKQFLTETMINKVGYVFRSVGFAQLGDFSYTEHVLSDNFSFALATGTTVIIQSDLGAKFYPTAGSSQESGRMRGSAVSIMPSVTQLTGMARIGQSIVEGTGLSLTTRYQWNIQKQTRYLSSSYGVISDDELFDDHYGYEGLHTSLMLTQVLSESMLLRITGGVQNKVYSTLGAFDLSGNQVADSRVDNRSYVSFLLQKEFDIGITVKAAYDLIRNASNDAYYDYRNNAATLELTVPF